MGRVLSSLAKELPNPGLALSSLRGLDYEMDQVPSARLGIYNRTI